MAFPACMAAELWLFLPCEALREESQAPENLGTLVELVYVGRSNHGDALVVHDAEAVHAQAITHWHQQSRAFICLTPFLSFSF